MAVIDHKTRETHLKPGDLAAPVLGAATVVIVSLMIFGRSPDAGAENWFGEWRTGAAIVASAILMVLLHQVFQLYFSFQERAHRMREQISSDRRELEEMGAFLEARIATRSRSDDSAEDFSAR